MILIKGYVTKIGISMRGGVTRWIRLQDLGTGRGENLQMGERLKIIAAGPRADGAEEDIFAMAVVITCACKSLTLDTVIYEGTVVHLLPHLMQ